MIFRQGRHNKQLIYVQAGERPDDDDVLEFVAVGDSDTAAHNAAVAVEALNAAIANG